MSLTSALNTPQIISTQQLSELCHELGVELMGVTELVDSAGELASWYQPHSLRLSEWVERGAHADMDWIPRQLAERGDPRVLLPEVRSAVTLWVSHHFDEALAQPSRDPSDGEDNRGYEARVARYAWGRDYHNVLRRVLRRLVKWISAQDTRHVSHGSVDTSPVLERAIAERCGVGWIGRSTMLIHPQRGTFGSLAVLLTSATFDELNTPVKERCGTCTACITRCPTGALDPEGKLDARLCISYWTIEHRGVIPRELRAPIGEWVFGCDLCQDVCPWSVKAARRTAPPPDELWRPQAERARPDLLRWLKLSDEALGETLLGSPLRRAFPRGLKRNALIVLANQRYVDALPSMWSLLEHPDLGVRVSAVWAITTLTLELARRDEISVDALRAFGETLRARVQTRLEDGALVSPEIELCDELRWADEELRRVLAL